MTSGLLSKTAQQNKSDVIELQERVRYVITIQCPERDSSRDIWIKLQRSGNMSSRFVQDSGVGRALNASAKGPGSNPHLDIFSFSFKITNRIIILPIRIIVLS